MIRPLTPLAAVTLAAALLSTGCAPEADARIQLTDPPTAPPSVASRSVAAAAPAAKAPPHRPARPARAAGAIHLTGRTAATRQSQVTFRAQGILAEVKAAEGDAVEAGQVLATVDDTVARLRVRQARTSVRAAEVQVRGVKREADRLKALRAKDAVPAAQYDQVLTQLEGAHAQLEQAKAGLAMARQGLADMRLKAPYAGRVVRRLKSEGEWVANMPPSPVLVLAQLDPLELRLEAPGQAYGQLQVGAELSVRLPSVGRTATVSVTRIIPSIGRNRAFTVLASLPNPDGALPAGLFAEAEVSP